MLDKGKTEGANRKKICTSLHAHKDGEIYSCLPLAMRFAEIGAQNLNVWTEGFERGNAKMVIASL